MLTSVMNNPSPVFRVVLESFLNKLHAGSTKQKLNILDLKKHNILRQRNFRKKHQDIFHTSNSIEN